MVFLSIVVPVYNVENYIRPCIESIFKQGLDDADFEVIVVNDGSTDDSIGMIDDVISNHKNVYIINQSNQGLSVARNNGLERATGKFVAFLDSDDLLVDNTLEKLMSIALDSSADMVVSSFVKMNDDEIEKVCFDSSIEKINENVLFGRDAFIKVFNPNECFVWRTIYRKDFLLENSIRFIPGICFEDIPFTTKCYLNANRVAQCDLPFYIYRQHSNSIVSTVNCRKLLDFNVVLKELCKMRINEKLSIVEDKKMSDVIFSTFSHQIWYITHVDSLYRYRKCIVDDFKKDVPVLLFDNGIKQLVVSFLYRLNPYMYLRIRHLLR
jgi:glycosyltransferase involved in cell wall biosynthesis